MKNTGLKGFEALLVSYLFWGTQPLYYSIFPSTETLNLMLWRILFAGLFCFIILAKQGKLNLLKQAFTDKQVLKTEIPATLFLAVDWFVFLFAVKNGKVQECALGYYIQPVTMFVFGLLFFKEKFSWHYIIIFILIISGIWFFADEIGSLPFVTVILALAFSFYAFLKKGLSIDSIVSSSLEIMLMLPFAFILLFIRAIASDISILSGLKELLFLLGSGLVTCLPMLFYGVGVSVLPLTVIALSHYISPTINLLSSFVLDESITKEKVISFVLVWAGIILFTAVNLSNRKK